jgi:hypothetical protein
MGMTRHFPANEMKRGKSVGAELLFVGNRSLLATSFGSGA